ncbi:MAG: PadR family transcriptional regulator [Thermoplasmata archaeon]
MLSRISILRRGMLKLLILKMLAKEPLHGYSIIKRIEKHSNGMWTPSPGSIYPALQSLEKDGYVISKGLTKGLVKGASKGLGKSIGKGLGNRKVYKITQKGKKSLEKNILHLKKTKKFIEKVLAI